MRKWINLVTESEANNPHALAAMEIAKDDVLFNAVADYVVNYESGIGNPDDTSQLERFTAILRKLPKVQAYFNMWRGECRSSWREKFGRGFHSWSMNLKTARYFKSECWVRDAGSLLFIDKPVRFLTLEDIITARMRVTDESHYVGMQAEVFVLDEDAVRVAREIEDGEADRIHNRPRVYKPPVREAIGNRDRTFYHVTLSENLPSIMEKGLVPTVGARSQKLGETEAIFLFTSIEDAEDAVMNWLGDEFDDDVAFALLEVVLPADIEVYRDPHGNVEWEVYVKDRIPPDCLRVLEKNL